MDFLTAFTELLKQNIYVDFAFDFLLNLLSVSVLCYLLYYKRYHNRTSTTLFMLFNIFIFSVIAILFSGTDKLSIGFGFGLFAVLSIITLRSEPLAKIEMAYFFGALALGIINAIGLDTYLYLILANLLIVLGAWIVDNPRFIRGVSSIKVTLDHIPDALLTDAAEMKNLLSAQLHIQVISFEIVQIDYVKDLVKLHIHFRSL